MKMKKITSLLLVAVMMVFGVPQYSSEVEAATTTNYARAIAEYQTVYNVADYGADLTGKNDSGAAITALIRKIYRERTDESMPIVIYMPSGNYKLNNAIKLFATNLHLIAENDTVVTPGKKVKDMIEVTNTSNVSILGGKWDGNYKTTYIMKLNAGKDVTISECVFTRSSERGVHAIASTVTLNAVNAYKNKKYGISTSNKGTITLRNCNVYKNSVYGICVVDSVIHMENGNNKVYDNDFTGVAVSGSKAKIYASNNSFTGNGKAKDSRGHGIGLANAYGEISNNIIEKNKQCGISLIDKAKAVVSNNSIKNNGRHGIGSAEKCTLTAENNTITGNKWNGIMIRDKGTGTLTNNILNQNSMSGLSIEKSKATLTGNTMYKNKTNGIYVDASNITMNKNTITKNKAYGVYVYTNCTVKVVSGNVIKSNSKADIDATGSKLTIGKGNTVKNVIR